MDAPRPGDGTLIVGAGELVAGIAQRLKLSLVVFEVVLGHAIATGNEVAAVEVAKAAEAVVHHHEHFLGVATGAQDEEVIVHLPAACRLGSLLRDFGSPPTADYLSMSSLYYS